ncbi:MAG: hypothetical protein KJS97_11190 [Alphaproteobacteria bacterium]|nr:hypothetical protein [Alphaproteobacteria bacterium]
MTTLNSPLSTYLAATCLYAAFGLPYLMGVARVRARPAATPAPAPAPVPVPSRR